MSGTPRPPRPPRQASRQTSALAEPASPWLWGGASAALVLLLLGGLAWWWLRPGTVPDAPKAAPLPQLSVAQWLSGHASDWRTGWLQEEPAVLVIEFPNLAEQGVTMNRIAALLEKTGAPRDRVLGELELAGLIALAGDTGSTFYQGHDYRSAGLARFFTLAQSQGLALNPHELRLRELLVGAGVLAAAGPGAPGYMSPAVQALITFTATQADDPATPGNETIDARQRESIFRHELSHGRFYSRPVYQAHCRQFWREAFTEPQRERIRSYLAGAGYNRQDEELMLNEAQAFLMHTPDQRAFRAQDIGMDDIELEMLRERFWRTLPPE